MNDSELSGDWKLNGDWLLKICSRREAVATFFIRLGVDGGILFFVGTGIVLGVLVPVVLRLFEKILLSVLGAVVDFYSEFFALLFKKICEAISSLEFTIVLSEGEVGLVAT